LKLNSGSPTFVACTGALSSEFFRPQGHYGLTGNKTVPAELPAGSRWDLISFTFGGNDIDFADTITACIGLDLAGLGGAAASLLAGGSLPGLSGPAALETWKQNPSIHCPSDAKKRSDIATSIGPSSGYVRFLQKMAAEAVTPGGNVVIAGYPEAVEQPSQWVGVDAALGLCGGIRPADALELRGLAGDLNATIAEDVKSLDAQSAKLNNVHFTYVDVNTGNPQQGIAYSDQHLYEPSKGPRHNLCASQEWLNGLTVAADANYPFARSFHPNQQGNDATAALIQEAAPTLDWSTLAQPTKTMDLAPVDVSGKPVSGLQIVDGGMASNCGAGSDSVGQAYRCFGTGGGIHDPCWLDNSDPNQASVLCQEAPWDTKITRLKLVGNGVEPFTGPPQAIDRDVPWGVRLSDGERCLALQGAHNNDNGRIVDYNCGDTFSHVLLRGVDRSKPEWTYQSAQASSDGSTYQPGPVVTVTTAWYANPDVGAAVDAKANDCTATALAYAAQTYEEAHGRPNGPLPAIRAFGCNGGYAEFVFTQDAPPPGYEASYAFRQTPGGWQEVGTADYIAPGEFGIPTDIGTAIQGQLSNQVSTAPGPDNVPF
ncbi:MAG: hypothetical protein M3256_19740, partial [Actinomycetota bacterium]|nr:hypothetical protein [Actinomycetota bacterium]